MKRLLVFALTAAIMGCGGHGLKRGISARCMDGQLDFASSCGALCFGRGGVHHYIQGCDDLRP